MKITIVYADWRLLRERADASLKAGETADFYMGVTMKGEDHSERHPDAYEVVYNVHVPRYNGLTDHEVLDLLFERFNIGDHGGCKDIRSMSVGDQVAIDGRRAYVYTPVGWEQLLA